MGVAGETAATGLLGGPVCTARLPAAAVGAGDGGWHPAGPLPRAAALCQPNPTPSLVELVFPCLRQREPPKPLSFLSAHVCMSSWLKVCVLSFVCSKFMQHTRTHPMRRPPFPRRSPRLKQYSSYSTIHRHHWDFDVQCWVHHLYMPSHADGTYPGIQSGHSHGMCLGEEPAWPHRGAGITGLSASIDAIILHVALPRDFEDSPSRLQQQSDSDERAEQRFERNRPIDGAWEHS